MRALAAGILLAALAGAGARAATATITISGAGGVPISPLLYGVNYVWDKVPGPDFAAYQAAMGDVAHASLSRYLGGWGAEAYDWSANTESGKRAVDAPGEAPDGFLAAVPAASFITPSAEAIKQPEMIGDTVKQSVALVSQYGGRVKYWEIGNEWWLQAGAKKNPARRAENLAGYARLLASVAPAMKAADPSIKIFAMADWAAPDEVAQMRQMAGAGWDAVDGISVHSYCGATDETRRCTDLPAAIAAVRQASGKPLIYASEWAAVRGMNLDDDGIRNAGLTVCALGDMAFAGINLGAYWPPVNVLPGLSFVSGDYRTALATGVAFGWMAKYYEGQALPAGGDMTALAARDGGDVNVIVPSGDSGPVHVRILLTGTGLRGAVDGSVLFGANKDGRVARIAALPVTTEQAGGKTYAAFDLDPGGADRGAAYEIARVTLR
jgi:hypothetical protein